MDAQRHHAGPGQRGSVLAHWLWLATAGAATACFVVLAARPAHAQSTPGAFGERARTESPYFFVKGADPSVDALPLKSTDVQVRISGVIADVTVTQVYRNEGSRAIEARYVFPGSTRAAVHGMNVRLGERLITADIREKQRARIEYDAARREGKTAALLEQQQPNVFQMNVANILPGDDVRVELKYTELLLPQAGQYQFVFPTVVGPRYNSPGSSEAASKWVAQPFLAPGKASPAAFDLHVFMATPIPLQDVTSPSHAIHVAREARPQDSTGDRASVTLGQGGPAANDRDFILDYRLAGAQVQSGLLLHRGEKENFFLAMIEPPQHVAPAAITPRDYIFVVDVSGSMHGFPLDTAKALLTELIGGLRASDTFNVMLFSGSNRMLSPQSVPATQANIDRALATIDQYQG
ncbi:MAG: VWA domain-containing protein, partial [Lysobacteraceae bacterium]